MSLIELMIAIAIGLVVLAALSMLFVQNSANRREIDRSASVLENGRYALSILKDELSLAGYYGTLSVPSGTAVPCSKVISDWSGSLAIPAQGINNNDADLAGCVSATPATLPARKGNTDAIVIQRTSTCVAGTTDCAAPVAANAYLQVSECGTEYLTTPFVLALGTGTFGLKKRVANNVNCDATGTAPTRQFYRSFYYVDAANNLTRADWIPGGTFATTVIAENIENMQLIYGFDTTGDGTPDEFATAPPGTSTWANAVGVRIWLLARAPTATSGYTNNRSIEMDDYSVTPSDSFKRHVFSTYVTFINPAARLFK